VQAVAPVVAPVAPAVAPIVSPVAQVVAPVSSVSVPVAQALAPVVSAVQAGGDSGVRSVVASAPQPAAAPAGFEPTTPATRAAGSAPVAESAVRAPAAVDATVAPGAIAQGAAGGTSSSAPAWTSPALIGPDAAARFEALAAAIESHAPRLSVRGGDDASGGGGGSPLEPGAPCNAGSTSAGGTAGSAGGWVAVPVMRVVCRPASAPRRLQLPAALWRPAAFVSLQERPG
jgi:hypothetical protein